MFLSWLLFHYSKKESIKDWGFHYDTLFFFYGIKYLPTHTLLVKSQLPFPDSEHWLLLKHSERKRKVDEYLVFFVIAMIFNSLINIKQLTHTCIFSSITFGF